MNFIGEGVKKVFLEPGYFFHDICKLTFYFLWYYIPHVDFFYLLHRSFLLAVIFFSTLALSSFFFLWNPSLTEIKLLLPSNITKNSVSSLLVLVKMFDIFRIYMLLPVTCTVKYINWFNPTTLLCLSEARTWISIAICPSFIFVFNDLR